MDLKKCQIFTPTNIVNIMLDQIDYKKDILNKTIIDISCGDGQFLKQIVYRIIETCKTLNYSDGEIKAQLENCVYGIEKEDRLVKQCVSNLNEVAKNHHVEDIDWNITCGDGLEALGEYDFVVGNPPYIAYKDLDIETRKSVKDRFTSCALGKFDYSYAFIEKGLELLKANGQMVYITPGNMFKTVFGQQLRELIKPYLTCVIDCAEEKIFPKALTSPMITLYKKSNFSKFIKYSKLNLNGKIQASKIIKSQLCGKWIFTDYVSAGKRRFGDYFKVSNCVATLSNNIFVHNIDDKGALDIEVEDEILRPAVSPKSLKKNIRQRIIFPYLYENGKLIRYSEEDMRLLFPKALQYLEINKKDLTSRDLDRNAKWFEYGRSQALTHLNNRKLLISSIMTGSVNVYELDEETVPYSGFYIIPKEGSNMSLDFALKMLQSSDMWSYLLSCGIRVNGESVRLSTKDIENYIFI